MEEQKDISKAKIIVIGHNEIGKNAALRLAVERGMDGKDIIVIDPAVPEDMALLKDLKNVPEIVRVEPETFKFTALPKFDEPLISYSDFSKPKKCRAKLSGKGIIKRRAKNKQAKKSRAKNRKK